METEKRGAKVAIVPTIIAVVTMLVLTVGATYAYFTVSTTNSFTSATATASVNGIGGVTLTTTNSAISMSLTATSMLSANAKTYYASTSGVTTTSTTAVTLGTLTASGAGTYSCTLTVQVALSSADTMIAKLKSMTNGSTGQIKFYIQGTAYDAYSTTFPYSKSITISSITSSSSKTLTGGLAVTNSASIDQTDLAGTSTTLTYTVTAMSCSLTSG